MDTMAELIKANKELADKICDLQIDYNKACKERDECASELLVCETAYQRCKDENCALHLALFHVENGCNHPDPEIRMLIQAASKAAAQRFTPNKSLSGPEPAAGSGYAGGTGST